MTYESAQAPCGDSLGPQPLWEAPAVRADSPFGRGRSVALQAGGPSHVGGGGGSVFNDQAPAQRRRARRQAPATPETSGHLARRRHALTAPVQLRRVASLDVTECGADEGSRLTHTVSHPITRTPQPASGSRTGPLEALGFITSLTALLRFSSSPDWRLAGSLSACRHGSIGPRLRPAQTCQAPAECQTGSL
ncbi:hypothetical protein SKAU_G00065880 [Synaphobranchus kaupii]|uniref:Uncharacterized protein n=1 Tax=Synaphobranchus kaupii TaxID=118154 RepID=A0A9Q1JAU4_SYNKA|nr:hypothetical protein SKAU_G00065880 [Synaphobranchus kaupii]